MKTSKAIISSVVISRILLELRIYYDMVELLLKTVVLIKQVNPYLSNIMWRSLAVP